MRGLNVRRLALSSQRIATPLLMSTAGGGRPTRSTAGASALLSMAAFVPHKPIAERAMAFLDASPDPFHATQNSCERLESAGFTQIDERDAWAGKLAAGGKYYFTRDHSCVVAFAIGGAYTAGTTALWPCYTPRVPCQPVHVPA